MRSWHGNLSPFGSWHSARGATAPFSPASLFALAEPGVWYDPSDLTTLFQDVAGLLPVLTPGQTVALALDKSKGLVLGSERIADPTLTNQTGWTASGDWVSVSGGFEKTATTANSNLSYLLPAVVELGKTYEITVTVNTASLLNVYFGTSPANGSVTFTGNGTFKQLLTVVNTLGGLASLVFRLTTAQTGAITAASVRELPGNHATQATAASRPTYAIVPSTGRRNLLTFTDQFDNAGWTKTAATIIPNTGIAPDGTVTADSLIDTATISRHIAFQTFPLLTNTVYTLSVVMKRSSLRYGFLALSFGAPSYGVVVDLDTGLVTDTETVGAVSNIENSVTSLGNGLYRVSVRASVASGTSIFPIVATSNSATPLYDSNGHPSYLGVGESILIWGAQLETGSTATAYQRVGTAFDVTEAGVPSLGYLSFDGVDDFLVTPTITPGIDKAQVFAGVRKLSDAAVGVIAEFSASFSTNAGAFVTYNQSGSGLQGWGHNSRGTSTANNSVTTGYAAPVTNVLTGLGDISGDLATLRVDGTQVAQLTTDQGTGNFLAYPLYIGRRGGASLPFNGHLYNLIVRFGANLDAATITKAERFVGGKTGVTIP